MTNQDLFTSNIKIQPIKPKLYRDKRSNVIYQRPMYRKVFKHLHYPTQSFIAPSTSGAAYVRR